tara:strand:- start:1117 stop:1359 length:243 start_codon:yes stop_codon:yes gene_type:complete
MSASKLTFGFLISVLAALLLLSGCKTTKKVIHKKIYFAKTNGVTTIYYPLKHPHQDKRWKYIASDGASDDGKPKLMVAKP